MGCIILGVILDFLLDSVRGRLSLLIKVCAVITLKIIKLYNIKKERNHVEVRALELY